MLTARLMPHVAVLILAISDRFSQDHDPSFRNLLGCKLIPLLAKSIVFPGMPPTARQPGTAGRWRGLAG
jgi:hypothetical protein